MANAGRRRPRVRSRRDPGFWFYVLRNTSQPDTLGTPRGRLRWWYCSLLRRLRSDTARSVAGARIVRPVSRAVLRPLVQVKPRERAAPAPSPKLPGEGALFNGCLRTQSELHGTPCRPSPGVSLPRDLPPIVVTGRRGLASRSRRGCRPAAAPSLLVRLGPRRPPLLPVGACTMRATHPTPRGGG